MTYEPPYTLNTSIFSLLEQVNQEIGMLKGLKVEFSTPKLRKQNSIKTIQASLAIEGNTLSLSQVTALFEGKRVLGPQKEIIEVQNAINVYDHLNRLDPLSPKDFLKAHGILMNQLDLDAGAWRKEAVGIFKQDQIRHLPPPADKVPHQMEDLFIYLQENEHPWLIKACVFHYELEFIHPFMDGNGRMGRLWQQRIAMNSSLIFGFISVEECIKNSIDDYYKILSICDSAGDSTKFIVYSLEQILLALKQFSNDSTKLDTAEKRLSFAEQKNIVFQFLRRDYQYIHPDISTATASRDLVWGVENGILEKSGFKNQTRYCFKKRSG